MESKRDEPSTRVSSVHLEGLALLKMIKHCRESLPSFVSGCLLGLDVGRTLEVTNCFPCPSAPEDDGADDSQDFQLEMLKSLREVNADHNQIGWYSSTYLGYYCTKDIILTQYEFQSAPMCSNAVVISYDPVRSTAGNLSIKAMRLTEKFMNLMREKAFDPASLATPVIKSSSVFEEVPIRIHNSKVVEALLLDLQTKEDVDCDFSRLQLGFSPFLEKVMEYLMDQVDELVAHQSNASYWARKLHYQKRLQEEYFERLRAENEERVRRGQEPKPEVPDPTMQCFKPLPEGSRQDKLEGLLVTAQISTYCKKLNSFAGQAFGKLFLAHAVGSSSTK